MKVGFIGLGRMGTGIAKNINKKYQTLVWDINKESVVNHTKEFGTKAVPSAGNSSVLTIPFDCKLVSASVKWINNSAVTILNGSDSWQVKLFKMDNPSGSVTLTANYAAPVDITGILLTVADNNTFPAKFATGLNIDLVAGDIINISGVESGTIGTSDGEMEMTLGFEAV